jgi:NTE family protein
MNKTKNLLILLLIIFFPILSIAQNQQKPKVGLVLSGGGAKGIAHLGMLHALDSLGIEPDYITGTSMGSIIGALYAIGYSADQIDSIISVADWNYVLSDEVPLNDIEISKKHSYERSLIKFNFSGNLIPKLPSGIVYGQHISEYFSKLTWRVADVDNFNDFEIPYKCVSADLISGNPYFFDHGNLAIAMRSSMSIPTVFSPMEIDTLLLVDGGVYRNFPVIDAKEMGAEIIIGSYTGFPKTVTFEDMRSLTNILIRASVFAGIQDIQKQEDMCDFYIKYDLHGLGTKDFKKGVEIIEYGKESIQKSSITDSLVRLAQMLKQFPKTERKRIPERDSIIISGFNTSGLSMVSKEFLISKSGLEIGDKISKNDMGIALNNMMGTLLFDKITYTLDKDTTAANNDTFVINYDIVEKSRGHMFISLNYDNFFGPAVSTDLMARNFLLSGSEIKLMLNISENPMIHFNYDFLFGKNKKFQSSFKIRYETLNKESTFIVDKEESISLGSEISTYSDFIFDFGYNFNSNNKIGVNVSYQISKAKFKNGSEYVDNISRINENGGMLTGYYKHNNYNKQFYPNKGFALDFNVNIGNSFDRKITTIDPDTSVETDTTFSYGKFYQIQLKYRQLIKLGSKSSLQPYAQIGFSLEEVSIFNKFNLGGYSRQERINNINMLGSTPYSYPTDNYIMLGLDFQYEVINNLYINLLSNATIFEIFDYGNNEFIDEDSYSVGLTLGYMSPLGPIDAGVSINDYGSHYWHVNIGFPF